MYPARVDDDHRVVVVGSGPAGATAAKFLCEAGIEVTLIEAGRARSERGLTARIAGMTVARVRGQLKRQTEGVTTTAAEVELYEELAPGGLTNHWSCAVPRFSRTDFLDAERAGVATTWPIGYEDLAPWYDRGEPLLHISGPDRDVEQLPAGKVRKAWRLDSTWARVADEAGRQGRSVTPLPYAYGFDTAITLSGTVFTSLVRLVKPALRWGRVKIVYGARVRRLEWSSQSRRVEAVVYRDAETGAERRVPCRAVVLAAGAVNTAGLLLASTSDEFPAGLGNTHGVLGHYLHDHPLGKLMIDLSSAVAMYPPAYITRRSLERARPLYAAACVQWTGAGMLGRSVLQGRPGRLRWVGFNVFGTMAPTSQSYVALDPTNRCADGSPALTLHIRHPPEAEQTVNAARDELMELLARAGLEPTFRL